MICISVSLTLISLATVLVIFCKFSVSKVLRRYFFHLSTSFDNRSGDRSLVNFVHRNCAKKYRLQSRFQSLQYKPPALRATSQCGPPQFLSHAHVYIRVPSTHLPLTQGLDEHSPISKRHEQAQ